MNDGRVYGTNYEFTIPTSLWIVICLLFLLVNVQTFGDKLDYIRAKSTHRELC